MIKKRIISIISIILTGVLALSLAAWGTSEASNPSSTTGTTEAEVIDSFETNTVEPSQRESSGKTLIVYFSPSNSDTVDAVTSATPRVGDTPITEYLAQTIEKNIDADIAKIIPETAYPIDYDETADQAKSEQDNNERPSFSLDVNPEEYDTVFVGYPIWWYGLPMVMETFFDTYDFGGKTIIPFNAHLGSRDGGTYADIAELEPDATVLNGIAFSVNDVDDAEKEIPEWLSGLGY